MTMLNAAPTATTAPAGGSGSAASGTPVPLPVPLPTPTPSHRGAAAARERDAKTPEFHLLGSGATATPGATGVAAQPGAVTVPLDQFARQGGPDAAVKTASGIVNLHAVFQLDAKTHQLTVAIVNENGELVRMIPPDSVSRMIAAMATYRGR